MGRPLLILVLVAGLAPAQPRAKDGEWPSYAADTRGSRYRPLSQIDASNFGKLEIAWRFKTDNLGARPEFKLEGTPLMAGGTLYATAGFFTVTIARKQDPATGATFPHFPYDSGKKPVMGALPGRRSPSLEV